MEPFFALSWIITWFSHDVRDTALVKRLFDFFIVSHPLMPVYMSIAMVCHPNNRTEVLNADCDFASVHKALSQLPRNSCSVGWKLVGTQCDTEYISEDEHEEECVVDGTSILGKCKSEDNNSIVGCGDCDEASNNPPSLASSSLFTGGYDSTALVPFQELIELSIEFMRRIPPRELMSLAQDHYGANTQSFEQVDPSSIALLQPRPPWATANSVPSDWTLKKRAREMLHTTTTNNDKKKPSGSMLGRWNYRIRKSASSSGVVMVQQGSSHRAVIAAGQGPNGNRDKRRTRRRRKRAKIMAVLVPIISWVVMFVQDVSYTDVTLFATTATIKVSRLATAAIRGTTVVEQHFSLTNLGNDGVIKGINVGGSMDDHRQNKKPSPFFSLAQTLTKGNNDRMLLNGEKTGIEMDTSREDPSVRGICKQKTDDDPSLCDLAYDQDQSESTLRRSKKDDSNLKYNIDDGVEKRKHKPLRRFQSWIKGVQKELDGFDDISF